MNQRSDVGGSRQQQQHQTHQVIVHDPVQAMQQELARVFALRQRLQREQDEAMAYEAGLTFAASKLAIDRLMANSISNGHIAEGGQRQIAARNAVMERMLEQNRPAAPTFGQPAGWTSSSALPRPINHTNGGSPPLEINHNPRSSTSTAVNGNGLGSRVDNRDLIHHTWSAIDQLRTVPQADLRANAYHVDLAQQTRNAVDSVRDPTPAIHPQVVQQLERFTTDRRGIDRANREELQRRHRTQSAQQQNAFAVTTANASTFRPMAVQNTSRPPAVPSARIEVIESTQQAGRAQPQASRAEQQTAGSTAMNGRPRDQPTQTQQKNGTQTQQKTGTQTQQQTGGLKQGSGMAGQAKMTPITWKDVAENLELPQIASGFGIVEPLMNPNVEARIVYTQYRIAELLHRTSRNLMENQFLAAFLDWARESSFVLPTTEHYPKLLHWVTTLKNHESSRLTQKPAIRKSEPDAGPSASTGGSCIQTTRQHASAPTTLALEKPSPSDVQGVQATPEKDTPPAKALLAILKSYKTDTLDTMAPCDQGRSRSTPQASPAEGARHTTAPVLAGPSKSTQISPRSPIEKATLPPCDTIDSPAIAPVAHQDNKAPALAGPSNSPQISPRAPIEKAMLPLDDTPALAGPVSEPQISLRAPIKKAMLPLDDTPALAGPVSEPQISLRAPIEKAMLPPVEKPNPVETAAAASKPPDTEPRDSCAVEISIHSPAAEPVARQPIGQVNMRIIRSIPPDRMRVEIPLPIANPRPRTRPKPRPRSLSPRKFTFWPPGQAQERFNKDCVSKVLSATLLKRCSLRQCRWAECDAELASEWQIQRHFAKVHAPRAKLEKRHRDEVDAWPCLWKECSGFYASQDHLEQHVRTIHLQEGLRCPYATCPRPEERYFTVTQLEGHIARNPLTHERQHVRPLTNLSMEIDHRIEIEVPSVIRRADLLPIKAPRSVWQTARQKANAINRVQEFSYIDRKDRRMRSGESPPPIDMPIAPVPATTEESEEVPSDTILVKREKPLPYVPKKSARKELELEVVIEISRPLIVGS